MGYPSKAEEYSSEYLDFIRCCLESNPDRRWSAQRLLDEHPLLTKLSGAEAEAQASEELKEYIHSVKLESIIEESGG